MDSDKLSYEKYGYPWTAAAGGDYDEVPLIAGSTTFRLNHQKERLATFWTANGAYGRLWPAAAIEQTGGQLCNPRVW